VTVTEPAPRLKLIGAFASLWVIWGSTYLAIRLAIDTLPPLLMSGVRFLVAGALLLAWVRWRGEPWPSAPQIRAAAIVGALLLLFGNGGVAWAEQFIPSGLAALIVAIVPAWMVLFDWIGGASRPGLPVMLGLALGFLGVGVLVGPEELLGQGSLDPTATLVICGGTIAWALGSIYSRHAPRPRSPRMSTAIQMLWGGLWLTLTGFLSGEHLDFDLAAVTPLSIAAWLYLVVFGSIIAYGAYVYLLQNTEPAKASTYAYVNPVIAVLLGWLVASEPLSSRVLLAVAIIIPAVALIVSFRPGRVSAGSAAGGQGGSSGGASGR
jgi:drug/metabolite transporter (DMT)-like permease